MAFYGGDQFPKEYRGGAFIAFHGSWNRAPKPQRGYHVAFVPFDDKGMPKGGYEVFADGFAGKTEDFTSPRDARFRACGLAVGPDGSLYLGDSAKGRVWRILYVGEKRGEAPVKPGPAAGALVARGAQLYKQACATCHMPDGSGVPGLQPALVDSPVVAGDPRTLIRVVMHGPAKALPP